MASRMALANELSSEIASAILTATEGSLRRLDELKEIVLRVHRTLQELAEKERTRFQRRYPSDALRLEK